MKTITYLLNLTLLAVCTQFAFADAPDWEDNAGAYEFTASMTAHAVGDGGETLGDAGDIMAAFDADGNVRGIASMQDGIGPFAGETLHAITIRSNDEGDEISFQYYDASEDAAVRVTPLRSNWKP